jgi:hypothetical protein
MPEEIEKDILAEKLILESLSAALRLVVTQYKIYAARLNKPPFYDRDDICESACNNDPLLALIGVQN